MYLPWVNGEVILMWNGALSAIAGFFEGAIIFQNVFVAFFLTAGTGGCSYMQFSLALSGKTYNEIEDQTAIFISILSNHAKGSSDIVSIMHNTIPCSKRSAKRYCPESLCRMRRIREM
jgi:hypothetical protein